MNLNYTTQYFTTSYFLLANTDFKNKQEHSILFESKTLGDSQFRLQDNAFSSRTKNVSTNEIFIIVKRLENVGGKCRGGVICLI